jgi:hypothetical protein
MARRARSYTRDARGRFASTPGGGAKSKPPRTSFRQRQAVSLARSRGQTGRLGSATKAAKARLKATRARTGAGASPQQKAALTRAKRMAAALAGERRVKTAGGAGILRGAAAKGVKKAAGARVRPGAAAKPPQRGSDAAARRIANSVRKGNLIPTTEADARNRAQALARAERKLAEYKQKAPRNVFGIDHNAIMAAESAVKRLKEPLPKYRKPNRGDIKDQAKKRHLDKRLQKRNAKFARTLQTRRKASEWYMKTDTFPASMRAKGAKLKRPDPNTKPAKQSPSQARGERILARLQAIGQGRTGRKLRQAQTVGRRAETFYRALAPSGTYERGAKAGQGRPRAERLSGLAKNLKDKEKIKKAQQLMSRAPASGIMERLNRQFNRRSTPRAPWDIQRQRVRTGGTALGPMSDAQYRQALARSGTRSANKIETSVAVRRRALEFLANPRSGQKLPALSRPVPQRKPVAPVSRPTQYTPPKREGIKATERQRAKRKTAESRYGIKHTRNSMRFGIKGKRTKAQIKRTATRRLFRRLEDVKGTNFVGSTARGSVYRFPVNQQYNIFGGVDRARAPRGRKIGTRKPGSRKIEPIKRRRG